MKDKQVYDLTPEDMRQESVWFFPMDEVSGDEATVRPLPGVEAPPGFLQTIVRTRFVDSAGHEFTGYVHATRHTGLNRVQPVVWVGDVAVSFWLGIVPPDAEMLRRVRAVLPPPAWPVTYASDTDRLPRMTGRVEGLYWRDRDRVVCVRV